MLPGHRKNNYNSTNPQISTQTTVLTYPEVVIAAHKSHDAWLYSVVHGELIPLSTEASVHGTGINYFEFVF